MTQDTQNDLPTQPNPLEAASASNTKAASGHQSNVHTNSDSNGGSGSNGQTPAGSDGPTATPSGSPNGNTHSNVNSTGDGAGSAYQRPCYGGSKGNGSPFDMDKEEYDKLMSKEKKYAKIGQKILDLADVKVNGTRPFDFNVHHPQLLQRVIQKGSLGLGEAFMEGWWDTTDFYSLHIFFEKILRGGIEYYFPNNAMDMANVLKARIINPQTKKKSKKVGLMHYDMGNEFFERMLGKYMQYSCGYWVQHKHESELTDDDRKKIRRQQEKNATYNSDTDGFVYDGFHDESTYLLNGTTDKENGAEGHMHAVPITDLEEAQFTKLKMIGDKLRLKPGMEVLDVGCGWGGLALFLAEHYHVKVVGITISEEQKKNAERMTAAYRDDITILNTDYRDIQAYYEKEKNEKNKKFDRIVSVGMFEHVGPKNYKKYFEVMRSLLNDEDPDAVFVLHTIGAKQTMESADQWYLRYIFPGGCLPSITNIGKNIENTFVMEDMHNFGYFYYLTLLAWRDRFLAYWVENHSMPNNVKRKQLETSRTAKKKSKEEKQAKKALKKKKSNSASSATPTPSGDPNAQGNHEQGFSPSSARNVTTADDEAVPAQATSTNGDHQATASTTAQASPETEQEKHDRETFFRMFYYYLSSSAGAFKARDLQLWQFVLSPNGVRGYPDVARA